jgi:TonB-dependent receptor
MALTNTLSRPNYFNLVPWERIRNSESTIERGNPDLNHTSAWNYDLFLSFYNEIGLFTIGGFYKELDNIDYIRRSRITSPGKYYGFTIIQPVNAEDISTVKGIEVDLQTNLRFLPAPWNGILIGANFSIMNSKTFYPLFDIGRDPQTGMAYVIDTVRTGSMPGQAEKLANLSIGYERKKFSARVSMVYQGESLAVVGTRKELDGYTDQLFRLDFVVQQKFGKGWSLYLNCNNITNSADKSYLGNKKFPTAEEYFGMTADFGIKFKF